MAQVNAMIHRGHHIQDTACQDGQKPGPVDDSGDQLSGAITQSGCNESLVINQNNKAFEKLTYNQHRSGHPEATYHCIGYHEDELPVGYFEGLSPIYAQVNLLVVYLQHRITTFLLCYEIVFSGNLKKRLFPYRRCHFNLWKHIYDLIFDNQNSFQ